MSEKLLWLGYLITPSFHVRRLTMKNFNICLLFLKKLFVLFNNLKTKILQIDPFINIFYQLLFHQVLTTKQAELNKKREDQEKLATRVSALESKLLTGTANMAAVSPNTSFEDVTKQQKLTLEKRRQEIIEREVIVCETLHCFYDLFATFPFIFLPFFCHFNFELFN